MIKTYSRVLVGMEKKPHRDDEFESTGSKAW